jgi:hypothetical protein
MTAGNDGASTPEDDDPFGYLYEDGQAGGAQQRRQGGYGYPGPAAQPGVPRTSYNQVRTVGERQYGQPPQQVPPQGQYGQPQQPGQGQQGPYGQQPGYGQQAAYGAPSPHYAAPETQPGGPVRQGPPPPSRGRSGGPNTRGLLIAAVAVVAAVVIGITVALLTSGGGDDKNEAGGSSTAPNTGTSQQPSTQPSQKAPTKDDPLPKQDAATLQLGAPAVAAKDVPGAKGQGGVYVSMPGPGASATWTVDVPKKGAYTLSVNYGVPGKDATMSVFVNDQDRRSINMKNFANAPAGDWSKGWTNTYIYVDLHEGSNTLKISCEQGDQCGVNLDQVQLKAGHVGG